MKLNFRTLGEGEPLIVLHGFFGSADNWQTLAKGFAEKFKVYLVDQRNHGLSPHSDVFDYDVMAADLKELVDDEGLTNVNLLGHSMGGKTAMNFAVAYPELVNKMIVVDIGPKQYPPHHENIFNGYKSVDLPNIKSRKEADDKLAESIKELGVRQFILKNLTRDDNGGFAWKINIPALEANQHEVGRALDPSDQFDGPTLFIGGGRSKYIQPEDEGDILKHFAHAQIKTIEGTGHWVHAEKPKELYEMVMKFLAD